MLGRQDPRANYMESPRAGGQPQYPDDSFQGQQDSFQGQPHSFQGQPDSYQSQPNYSGSQYNVDR